MVKSSIEKPGVKHFCPVVTAIVHGAGKVVLELKFGKETVVFTEANLGVPVFPEDIAVETVFPIFSRGGGGKGHNSLTTFGSRLWLR